MKKPIKVLVIVLVALVALTMIKNSLFQGILTGALSKAAHVPVKFGSTSIRFLTGSIDLRNIRVFNPKGFPEKLMLHAPQVAIDFQPTSLFQGRLHFKTVKLNMKELIVVKNKNGQVNIEAVKPSQKEKEQASKPKEKGKVPKLRIDELHLTIGKVVYKDYSQGPEPKVQVFEININDRVYTNIEDPTALVSLIMFEALTRTSLARIADMDLGEFQDTAKGVFNEGLGLVGDGASNLESKAKNLLSMFQ